MVSGPRKTSGRGSLWKSAAPLLFLHSAAVARAAGHGPAVGEAGVPGSATTSDLPFRNLT